MFTDNVVKYMFTENSPTVIIVKLKTPCFPYLQYCELLKFKTGVMLHHPH